MSLSTRGESGDVRLSQGAGIQGYAQSSHFEAPLNNLDEISRAVANMGLRDLPNAGPQQYAMTISDITEMEHRKRTRSEQEEFDLVYSETPMDEEFLGFVGNLPQSMETQTIISGEIMGITQTVTSGETVPKCALTQTVISGEVVPKSEFLKEVRAKEMSQLRVKILEESNGKTEKERNHLRRTVDTQSNIIRMDAKQIALKKAEIT